MSTQQSTHSQTLCIVPPTLTGAACGKLDDLKTLTTKPEPKPADGGAAATGEEGADGSTVVESDDGVKGDGGGGAAVVDGDAADDDDGPSDYSSDEEDPNVETITFWRE